MTLLKGLGTGLCLTVLCVLAAPKAKADDLNRKTVVTFSAPVEVRWRRRSGLAGRNLCIQDHGFPVLTATSCKFRARTKPMSSPPFWQCQITA